MFLSCSFGGARYRQEENKKMIKAHTLCERQKQLLFDDFSRKGVTHIKLLPQIPDESSSLMEEPFLTPAITINQEQIGIFKLKSYIGRQKGEYIFTK